VYDIVIAGNERLDRAFIKKVAEGIDGVSVVDECDCAHAAVDACLSLKPSMAILDCNIVAADGFDAAHKIRRSDRDMAILMTGWDENNFRKGETGSLLSLNIAEFLLKPIHHVKMREALTRHLKKKPGIGADDMPRERHSPTGYGRRDLPKEIAEAMAHIDCNFRDDVSLESVASCVSMSASYFSRMFRQEVGVNFLQYLTKKRLEYAKLMITQTDSSMLDIATKAGFREQNYFGKVFKRYTGLTPLEYKRNARREKSLSRH
jgi:YesN/AraC family two-component response regulator